jgi:hypothetical protein
MAKSETIAYQMPLSAKRNEAGELEWATDVDKINKLILGFDWQAALSKYNKRNKFYWGFSISGCGGEDLLPIIDAKIEMTKASIDNPEFMLEMAVMPGKLEEEHYGLLIEAFDENMEDPQFKFWWDNDPRGPRKRNLKVKGRVIKEVKQISQYSGADDLKLEDVDVSIEEAKIFFEFKDLVKKDIRKVFKKRLKEQQLKHHPDSTTGSEESFLYLQKCRNVLEKWLLSWA